MAPLPESFRAFQYQSGLDRIRDSFRASIATMTQAYRDARDANLRYLESGEDDREYDEDGVLVRSTQHELSYLEMESVLALEVVREAFVTSTFHYWERSARAWTALYDRNHTYPKLKARAAQLYPVIDTLDDLNTLNNLLKHDSDGLAVKLAMKWPELFRILPHTNLFSKKVEWRLLITDAHVEEVMAIVSASGPKA